MCVRLYDLMPVGLFYINVTGAGLIACHDFMQGRSLSQLERDASCRPRRTTFSAVCCMLRGGDDLIDCQLLRALRCLHECEIDFFSLNHRALCAKKAPKTWVSGRLVIEINFGANYCVRVHNQMTGDFAHIYLFSMTLSSNKSYVGAESFAVPAGCVRNC